MIIYDKGEVKVMKISACLIAKNEAENIGHCLENIYKIVDQIVVVDTGSTDKTVEIATSYGAEIYHYKWNADFAAAKNTALDKATGDWIIFLDADEYFSRQTVMNVPKVIGKYDKNCDGFMTQMVNIDVDQDDKILDQFFTTRIFRNDPNMRFVGTVHEQVQNKTGRRNMWFRIEPEEIQLIHTGYSSKRILKKCERNLALLLEQLKNNSKDVNLYRYLADTYYGLSDYDKAIQYAKLDIATGVKEISYASRSYRILFLSYKMQNTAFAIIEDVLKQAIHAFPDLPDFYAEYAFTLFTEERYDEVLLLLNKAFSLAERYSGMETMLFTAKTELTYSLLAIIYEHKNEYKQTIEAYQKILAEDKYNGNAFIGLYKMICQEDPVQTIAFLNTIYDKNKQKDLDFLIVNISKIKRGKMLAYYLHAQKQLLQQASIELLALECVGQYEKVQLSLRSQMEEEFVFTVWSAILLNDYEQIKGCLTYLPAEYQHAILVFYKKNNIQFQTQDFPVYKAILAALLQADEVHILDQYCENAVQFDVIEVLVIANLLKDKFYFQQAIYLYKHILSFELVDGKKDVLYYIGFCYYKIKEYSKAKVYFAQSIALGYQNDEIQTLLSWSKAYLLNTMERVEVQ